MKRFCLLLLAMIFMLSSFAFAEGGASVGAEDAKKVADSGSAVAESADKETQAPKSESTYVIRKFEATSSKDDPGKINVSSSFEQKTADGKVVKDSKNESVDVSKFNGYSIRMNDGDAGWTISEQAVPDDFFKDAFSDFDVFRDDFFNDGFFDGKRPSRSAFPFGDNGFGRAVELVRRGVRNARDMRDIDMGAFDDSWFEDDCDCYRCRRDRMMRNHRRHSKSRMVRPSFWF